MKYLIVQEWNSTKGNHAGMRHMCDLLVAKYPDKYRMIVKDCPPKKKQYKNKILRKLLHRWVDYKYRKAYEENYLRICQPMFEQLHKGDEVFLLEYNWPATSQYGLAKYIKNNYPGVKVYALSHITPTFFHKLGMESTIQKWDKVIDRQLTLGSSLSAYFESIGIDKQKISTGFHYVDNEYYKIDAPQPVHDKVTIITMGSLQRDYGMLAEIVKRCPDVNWIICRGRKKVDDLFAKIPNVKLKGYLAEDELRHEMSISNLSLNVLEDTVGSNVITTSMAMGLGIITSNVGSIHDYCDDTNAVFCGNDIDSFVRNINALCQDSSKIAQMKKTSYIKSQMFAIGNVDLWFSQLS